MFCTAEVTELENSAVRVEQEVLRFDVSMTNSVRMNVGKRSGERENIINNCAVGGREGRVSHLNSWYM